MQGYLKEINARILLLAKDFNFENKISPVSKTDAEIILNIFDVFLKLLKDDEQLVEIINEYKIVSDEKFLKKIKEYNESYDNRNGKNQIIEIGDFSCFCHNIFSIQKGKLYDFKTKKILYYLIINKSENNNSKIPHSNTKIFFESEELLEKEILALKTKLTKYTNTKFI